MMLEMVRMGDVASVGGGGGVGFVGGDEISGLLEVFLDSFGWIVEKDKNNKELAFVVDGFLWRRRKKLLIFF